MNKEDLKIGHIYRIEYFNRHCDICSYNGNAIYRGVDDGFEDDLYFDLLSGSKDKGCIFCIDDVVKEIGPANEPISFDPDKVTRIVVVGENGREFEKWFDKCEVSLQDDGRTVKFFTS